MKIEQVTCSMLVREARFCFVYDKIWHHEGIWMIKSEKIKSWHLNNMLYGEVLVKCGLFSKWENVMPTLSMGIY